MTQDINGVVKKKRQKKKKNDQVEVVNATPEDINISPTQDSNGVVKKKRQRKKITNPVEVPNATLEVTNIIPTQESIGIHIGDGCTQLNLDQHNHNYGMVNSNLCNELYYVYVNVMSFDVANFDCVNVENVELIV